MQLAILLVKLLQLLADLVNAVFNELDFVVWAFVLVEGCEHLEALVDGRGVFAG